MFLWSLVLGSTVMHPIWSKCQLREDHQMCCRVRNFLKWRLRHRCFLGYLVKVFRKHFYRTRINLLDTIQNVYKAFRRSAKRLLNMLVFYATNLCKMWTVSFVVKTFLDTIQNVYKAFRRRAKRLLNMLVFYATNLCKMWTVSFVVKTLLVFFKLRKFK